MPPLPLLSFLSSIISGFLFSLGGSIGGTSLNGFSSSLFPLPVFLTVALPFAFFAFFASSTWVPLFPAPASSTWVPLFPVFSVGFARLPPRFFFAGVPVPPAEADSASFFLREPFGVFGFVSFVSFVSFASLSALPSPNNTLSIAVGSDCFDFFLGFSLLSFNSAVDTVSSGEFMNAATSPSRLARSI